MKQAPFHALLPPLLQTKVLLPLLLLSVLRSPQEKQQ
jgi:hypothetical protein